MCQKPPKQRYFSITKKQLHLCNCLKFNYLTCDPVGIRTQDPQLRRLLLYPAELPDRTFIFAYFAMEAKVGAKIVIFI